MLFFQSGIGCRGKIIKLISLGDLKKREKKETCFFYGLASSCWWAAETQLFFQLALSIL